MNCLVWHGKNDVRYEDRTIPRIKDDEILVKVAYVGICGSEMDIIKGTFTHGIVPPQILGHEFSGTVAKIGRKVVRYKEGDRITAHPLAGCGECYFCKRAQEHFCLDPFNVVADPRAGAFAEYTPVKAKQVYKLPEWMSLEIAALTEPISIAVHAVDLSNIKAGYTVAILGGGPIGLCCLQVAQHQGASLIILSDPVALRRKLARESGADIVIDPTAENIEEIVKDATSKLGVDVCIEAAGTKATCQQTISLTKNTGTVLVVGVVSPERRIGVSFGELNKRELAIIGCNWSPYCFIRTMSLMRKLKIEPLITHVFPLVEFKKALEVQENKEGVKVLFKL